MKKRVAINGFGRIGRSVARIIMRHYRDTLELVAINDPSSGHDSVLLFEFDSNFGRYPGEVSFDDVTQEFVIDGHRIKKFATREIEELPWGDLGVDVVLESTGVFRKKADCERHLRQGAKKVLLSAPPKDEGFKMIVVGVNDENLSPQDVLVSNASCTTNCLAPLAKALDDHLGIKKGFMTTVHSYTTSQRILDMADKKDMRRGRAGALNIIPTSTGAAKAIGQVLPHLNGKLDGMALRVPTPTVSLVDLTIEVGRETSVEEVNTLLRQASQAQPHILGFEERPLVSMDFKMDPRSSIAIPSETKVHGNLVKVMSWYDNEWGYSNRMADLVSQM